MHNIFVEMSLGFLNTVDFNQLTRTVIYHENEVVSLTKQNVRLSLFDSCCSTFHLFFFSDKSSTLPGKYSAQLTTQRLLLLNEDSKLPSYELFLDLIEKQSYSVCYPIFFTILT